jgi:hypothetical protein
VQEELSRVSCSLGACWTVSVALGTVRGSIRESAVAIATVYTQSCASNWAWVRLRVLLQHKQTYISNSVSTLNSKNRTGMYHQGVLTDVWGHDSIVQESSYSTAECKQDCATNAQKQVPAAATASTYLHTLEAPTARPNEAPSPTLHAKPAALVTLIPDTFTLPALATVRVRVTGVSARATQWQHCSTSTGL